MKVHKVTSVAFNNRKREVEVTYEGGQVVCLHYSQLKIYQHLQNAGVDPESGGMAFFVEKRNGRKDFIPYDIPLILSGDPDYLLQAEIEELLAEIRQRMKQHHLSKKFLARALETSDMQIERLLSLDNLNKNFIQLNRIAHVLGVTLSMHLKKVA